MLVYLVRHGQSFNTHPSPDEPDPANPPLTPIGIAESRRVAERLRSLDVDRLITSPMIRTVETALVVGAAVGLRAEVWPRCYEFRDAPGHMCAGGRGLRLRYPDLVLPEDFGEDDWWYGDEPLEAAIGRADAFLEWLTAEAISLSFRRRINRRGAGRMVVVTHGDFTRLTLGRILDAPLAGMKRLGIDNTAVSTIELTADGITALGFNDTSHLAGDTDLDPVRGVTR